MCWDFLQIRVPSVATSKFSPLVLWGWHWHLAGLSRNQTQPCTFFETRLSWAGDLCLFCGWITLVPAIPWEEESSVSSCRKSEDWGQAVSAEVLPCGFATSFLNNLSEGRSSLSQTESSRISSEVKKKKIIHINLVGNFLPLQFM